MTHAGASGRVAGSLVAAPVEAASVAAALLAVAVLVWAEARRRPRVAAVAKPLASSAFIVLGIVRLTHGPGPDLYGILIVAGLLAGAAGDALLLGRGRALFAAGLGAFLVGHGLYVAAFMASGLHPAASVLAAVVLAPAAVWTLRWLWPAAGSMRMPLALYVAVIAMMVATAFGAAWAGGPWQAVVGAVFFAVSDLFVARDRFVVPAFSNRALGLPLYYAGQLLLAWTAGVTGA